MLRLLAAALPLALAAGLAASPASAEVDPQSLGAAHFVGHWSLDGPEGCESRDTLSFFASGAWAVTNGGDNPVESIGTWELGPGAITVQESSLRRPDAFDLATVTILAASADRMEISVDHAEGKGRSFTLDRCA